MVGITRAALSVTVGRLFHTRVSFVTDGGCLAYRYYFTDKLRTQTDTRQLEL